MKTLFLIRHAKSSWAQPELTDLQRPLKRRGERDAGLIGLYLRRSGVTVEQLYSSPAQRALQTAQVVAEQLGISVKTDEGLYTFSEQALLGWLRSCDNQLKSIMAFGHNPAVTELVNFLAMTDIDNIPTAGLAQMDFKLDNWSTIDQGTATLSDYAFPKGLALPKRLRT